MSLFSWIEQLVSYDPKKYQTYKETTLKKEGKKMKIADITTPFSALTLTDLGEDTTYIQDDVPYRRWNSHKFPEQILITKINRNVYKNVDQICYFEKGKKDEVWIQVPKDMEVEGIDNPELFEEFQTLIMKDMGKYLVYSGLVGSDPEIFVSDNKDQLINAFDFLGSKKAPSKGKNSIGGDLENNVYWDGFQAEFDTRPNTCLAYHCDSVRNGLFSLLQLAKEKKPDAKLDIRTTMDVSQEILQSGEEEHVEFGCMPSYNVYGMKGVSKPGRQVPFRSAGGHIHFGIGKQTHESVKPLVEALDAILGVACVSLFEGLEDPRRRTMYGMAGEYRLPDHGVEYRVLSNAWLMHPMLMHMVFDLGRKVLCLGQAGLLKHWKGSKEETIAIIQNCDVKAAREVLARNEKLFKAILNSRYYSDSTTELCYKVFMGGATTFIETPNDLEKNWHLQTFGAWRTHSNGDGKHFATAVNLFLSKGKKVS